MEILVVGGFGYIGSHLLKYLGKTSKKGITCIDKLVDGNMSRALDARYYCDRIIIDDFKNHPEELEKAEVIIFLAARSATTSKASNGSDTILENKEDVRFLTKHAKKKHVVFPSTTSIYSIIDDEVPMITEYNRQQYERPLTPYARSKFECEQIIMNELESYCIYRFGSAYGYSTGIRYDIAIPKFVSAHILGQPIKLWRQNYDQYRPYSCLDLISNCLIGALYNKNQHPSDAVSVNLTLNEIIKHMKEVYPSPLQVELIDAPIQNQGSYTVMNIDTTGGFNKKLKYMYQCL